MKLFDGVTSDGDAVLNPMSPQAYADFAGKQVWCIDEKRGSIEPIELSANSKTSGVPQCTQCSQPSYKCEATMLTEALVVGDEVRDSEGYESLVIRALPEEIVLELIAQTDTYKWTIFARDRQGAWRDRENSSIHLIEIL